jgi:hypothetical protein
MLHILLRMSGAEKPLTSEERAKAMHTSPIVVRRVLAGLREADLVRSEKGHGGGWLLACDLATTMHNVYLAIDSPGLFAVGNRTEAPSCLVEQGDLPQGDVWPRAGGTGSLSALPPLRSEPECADPAREYLVRDEVKEYPDAGHRPVEPSAYVQRPVGVWFCSERGCFDTGLQAQRVRPWRAVAGAP